MPFGLNFQGMNGWLYDGGGQALWNEVYAPFGLVAFPCGNTGVQMTGWFKKEIKSVADFKGLKMRIPGLAGQVYATLGVDVNYQYRRMIHSTQATRGMAVAPHALASQSALAVLREGGNALEAMIAAAATIAVVYPHMNSIGGDSFWLMHVPGEAPGAIDACGAAARAATVDWYHERGITDRIPFRGGVAANTVAGTISGWGAAHTLSRRALGGRLPLTRLREDAIYHAEHGIVD